MATHVNSRNRSALKTQFRVNFWRETILQKVDSLTRAIGSREALPSFNTYPFNEQIQSQLHDLTCEIASTIETLSALLRKQDLERMADRPIVQSLLDKSERQLKTYNHLATQIRSAQATEVYYRNSIDSTLKKGGVTLAEALSLTGELLNRDLMDTEVSQRELTTANVA